MTAHPKPSVTQAASTYEAQDEAVAFRWWTDWRNCEGEELALKCAFARHRQSAEAASRDAIEEWKNEAAFYRHEARVRQSAEAASRARLTAALEMAEDYHAAHIAERDRAQAAEARVERLREAITDALKCTPSLHWRGHDHAEIVYDCGDPWAILRAALTAARIARGGA